LQNMVVRGEALNPKLLMSMELLAVSFIRILLTMVMYKAMFILKGRFVLRMVFSEAQ